MLRSRDKRRHGTAGGSGGRRRRIVVVRTTSTSAASCTTVVRRRRPSHGSSPYASHDDLLVTFALFSSKFDDVGVSYVFYFYSAMRMHSADYAVARCLCVRPSVTCQYCVKTTRLIIKLFSPSSSHIVLLFPYQTV